MVNAVLAHGPGGTDGGTVMPRKQLPAVKAKHKTWNKGCLLGQKRPPLPKQVWEIRARLELAGNSLDQAQFNLTIDSELRGCDLVKLKVRDLVMAEGVRERFTVAQSKTNRPVQFEVSENTRETIVAWAKQSEMLGCRNWFPSRIHASPQISTSSIRGWFAIGCQPWASTIASTARTRFTEKSIGDFPQERQFSRGTAPAWSHQDRQDVRYLGFELEDT